MDHLRSRKIEILLFQQKPTSASKLTCRRHLADTTQTLPRTLPQTLDELKADRTSLSGEDGITIIFTKKSLNQSFFLNCRNSTF